MNSGKKYLVSAAAAVVVLGLIGGGVWAYRARAHDQFVTSIQGDPRKVFEASSEGKITDQERDDVLKKTFESSMSQRLDDYFKLPPGPERTAYLDKQIDMMETGRKRMETISATQPALREALAGATTMPAGVTVTKTATGNGQNMVVRVRGNRQSMDGLPPARRAQVAEFMGDMTKRRAERGLSTDGPAGPVIIQVQEKK